jgi:sterol desaturase/sphingolipid hydroxylase (fatty acid hydroxylase superfamily)
LNRANWRTHETIGFAITIVVVTGVLVVSPLVVDRFSLGSFDSWASTFRRGLRFFLGSVAVYSFFEWLIPAGPHKSVRAWLLNFQVNVLYIITGTLAGAIAALLAGSLNSHFQLGWIDLKFAENKSIATLIGATLLFNFVFDFFYYWFHRFQHVSPVLWQQHKLHHMDEQLSALTTARQHWLEEFLRIPVIALPMAILFKLDKIDPLSLGLTGAIVGIILGSWSVFIHANIRFHFGFLGKCFAGPQIHRVHHSRLPQHHDRNFAAFFPVWDIIFGTYYSPARDEFPPTGVDGEREFETLGEAIMLPFREWRKMLRRLIRRNAASPEQH